MILGMTTATYTLIHVLISLVGIGTGFVVMYGLLGWKAFDRWTGSVSHDHGADQCDWIRLSLRSPYARE